MFKKLNHLRTRKNHFSPLQQTTEPFVEHEKIDMDLIKRTFYKNDDFIMREFTTILDQPVKITIIYFSGLVDNQAISQFITTPLMEPDYFNQRLDADEDVIHMLRYHVLTGAVVAETTSLNELIKAVLIGKTAMMIHGEERALLVNTQGFDYRNVEEPDTESVVRGPREGFNENIEVSTALLRRKIINPNLIFEPMTIGRETQTLIRIGYIEGIANRKVVQEVRNRLQNIEIDSVLESGYIEEYIEDHPLSLFETVGHSEKPDIIAGKILEGRICILCNGTPFVLFVPNLFIECLQVHEDYYSRYLMSSLTRVLRLVALFLSSTTPALYVAFTSYHHDMIPTVLLTSLASAEEAVPFPVFIEVLLMGTAFELLKEAGVRLPRPIGSAITIVGALIIGEAAVQAGIVSSPLVIVTALTGISTFAIPALQNTLIPLRLFLVLLAGALGLYGILIGFLMILAHMCSLRSFGTPYLSPMAPFIFREWKDTFIRMPHWVMGSLPQTITWNKKKRHDTLNRTMINHSERDGSES